MILFKVVWGINAVVSMIILYFFFIGLADGTVNERNGGLWFMTVAALAAIMLGSVWLRSHGHAALAMLLLLVLAVPAILFVLYFGLAIITKARWN